MTEAIAAREPLAAAVRRLPVLRPPHGWTAVWLLLSAATVVALCSTGFLPFYDYYQWLFQGHVVAVLLFGADPGPGFVAEGYSLSPVPVPNLAAPVLPTEVAGQVFIVVTVLGFACAFGHLVQPATGSFSDWGLAAELAPMIGVWRQLLDDHVRTPWGAAALAPRVALGSRPCDGHVDHATSPRQPRSTTCAARAGNQAIFPTCVRHGPTHLDGCIRGRAEESPPGDREDGTMLILADPKGSTGCAGTPSWSPAAIMPGRRTSPITACQRPRTEFWNPARSGR